MAVLDWFLRGLWPTGRGRERPGTVHRMPPDVTARRVRALGDEWPADAELVEAISWNGADGTRREKLTARAAAPPLERVWILQSAQDEVRVVDRPASAAELSELIAVLREAGASEQDTSFPVVEAQIDCSLHQYSVSFIAAADMVQGVPYKRWYATYHRDGRPPSVWFTLETRRDDGVSTLNGGAVLRGTPWVP